MSQLVHPLPTPELRPLPEDVINASSFLETIRFQFVPGGYQETVGANWSSSTGLGRQNPILQYANGEQGVISWDVRLWAGDQSRDVSFQLDALKLAATRDPKLKRPPRYNLVWGSVVDEVVVVQSLGSIRYDDPRPDGTIRGASLGLTLLIYRTVDITLAADDARGLLQDTFFGVAKTGEQWEDIALREYGDPDLGDLIRRRHPTMLFPGQKPGTIVKLPKLANLAVDQVEPDSGPLRRTIDGLRVRQRTVERLSKSRESAVVVK